MVRKFLTFPSTVKSNKPGCKLTIDRGVNYCKNGLVIKKERPMPKTIAQLIAELCDGDKNLKSRSAITLETLNLMDIIDEAS